MAITTRKLEVFLEVAEHANFRLAADHLGISQPSVSAQIADLEMELGFALFHRRSGARPHLTVEGHGFIQRAKEMISAHAGLLGEEARRPEQRKKLVIAAGAALFDMLRPDLPDLILDHPEVDIEFEAITQLHSTLHAMDEQLIDIGLYLGTPPRRCRGRVEIIGPVSYSVFASPKFAQRYSAAGGEPFPLILPPKGGWSTEPIRAMLAEAGVSTEKVLARCAFPDVLLELALSGVAAIVMPEDAVADHVREGALAPLKPSIGVGSRYLLIGPNARCPEGARVVRDLKAMVLARQGGQTSLTLRGPAGYGPVEVSRPSPLSPMGRQSTAPGISVSRGRAGSGRTRSSRLKAPSSHRSGGAVAAL